MKSLLVVFCLSVFCSCQQDHLPQETSKDRPLAVEIISKKLVSMSNRLINNVEYTDFVDSDVAQLMATSGMYANPMGTNSVDDGYDFDTLFFSEQIPVVEVEYRHTKIYDDGAVESLYERSLDPLTNPILAVYERPIDLEQFIARVEIKNGIRKCYSPKGKLLHSAPAEVPNMKEFLDGLREYTEMAGQQATRGGVKRDINWLRKSIEEQLSTGSGETPYYKIGELPNGHIVLEQELQGDQAHTRGMTTAGRLVSRVEISSDISRTMGYELKSGNTLLERRRYTYSESALANRNLYSPDTSNSVLNPVRVVDERLVFMSDGSPMIEVTTEQYSQNQTIFHFNNRDL